MVGAGSPASTVNAIPHPSRRTPASADPPRRHTVANHDKASDTIATTAEHAVPSEPSDIHWDDASLGWDLPPSDTEFPPFEPEDEEIIPTPRKSKRRKTQPATLADQVLATLRSVMSSTHGLDPEAASKLVSRVMASPRVLGFLPTPVRNTYDAVFEVLNYETTVTSTGTLDLEQLPVADAYSEDVAAEIAEICSRIGISTPVDPHAAWFSLVEKVQRHITRLAALDLAEAIEQGAPLKDLIPKHRAVEPPTTQKANIRTGRLRSAAEYVADLRAEQAGRPTYRFSSGLPTLDVGYTGRGEERGFIAPGQFIVVMGPTGTGKTSFSNSVTPAFGLDLINWGLPDAYQVMFHTEEESIDKIKGFRMDVGDKYHHLAKNLVIDPIGTSRRRMAETLYDLVISADEKARATRRPITEFLPYLVQVDYLQSIQEPGENEVEATAKTAEFLLRGVVAWSAEEMAKFSGVDFRTYAGMAWPTGMENHRVAVLGYAQLVKINDESLFYKAGKRGVQMSDFVVLNDKDEPLWDVREGDLRLFGKNQMRGSGIIAQNAHAIVILHRSVPYNNPAIDDTEGKRHLSDTRARILFDKSRAGSNLPYAPMRFDVQSNGFRAQYMDEIAERALLAGKLKDVADGYTEPGDPILPRRPRRNRLGQTKY